MGEPVGLTSMESHRVGHDWSDLAAAAARLTSEKAMAPHSSILAWRIPGLGEPGGLLTMGSHRVGHDWSNLAAAAAREEWYIKDLNDPDIHNGVITHLKPDILECEVKWALGSMTTNKASRGDEIPSELFKILMLLKCCTQYVSKFGKVSSGHRTRKRQFSYQCQRKAMPKNVQNITQLHSSHTLVK